MQISRSSPCDAAGPASGEFTSAGHCDKSFGFAEICATFFPHRASRRRGRHGRDEATPFGQALEGQPPAIRTLKLDFLAVPPITR